MPVENLVDGSIGWLSSDAPFAKEMCPKVGSGVSVGVGVSIGVGVTVIVGVGVTVGASAVMVGKNFPRDEGSGSIQVLGLEYAASQSRQAEQQAYQQ